MGKGFRVKDRTEFGMVSVCPCVRVCVCLIGSKRMLESHRSRVGGRRPDEEDMVEEKENRREKENVCLCNRSGG